MAYFIIYQRQTTLLHASRRDVYKRQGIQNVDPNLLLEVHDLSRFSTIVNYVDGQYLWAVSYTHLDVYKRQVDSREIANEKA